MSEGGAVQIIDAEHALGKFGRGEYPSAAQAAQSIGFGQAVGNDETLGIDMKRAGGRRFKQHLAVDFVHQNARADFSCQLSNFAQSGVGNKSASGVVEVANHDETSVWSEVAFNVGRINGKVIFRTAWKALDLQSQILGGAQDEFVSGLLYQNFIARFRGGGQRKVIRQ